MIKSTTFLIIAISAIALLLPCSLFAQDSCVLKYIQSKSDIKEGGSGLYKFKNDTYLISVSSLYVGTKTEQNCKTVGSAKAKRDMIAYVNGSDITSYTELISTETVTETLSGKTVGIEQKYMESIKETILGTINETKPLGGWYSDNQSVYYYAIYKIIQ